MKKLLLIICLSTWGLSAQESSMTDSTPMMENDSLTVKPKRISVGIKLGMPNIAGGNVEFVLPLLDNHFAPYVDISGFNGIKPDPGKRDVVDLSYSEYGLNYYFGTKGTGLYLSAGLGNLSTDIDFYDQEYSSGNNSITDGEGSIKEEISTTNLKIGFKSSGRVYFRIELGYGLGDIPTALDVDVYSQEYGIGSSIDIDFPNLPGVSEGGVIIGNIGLGISF